jgi:predicted glycogen debranching enzyme
MREWLVADGFGGYAMGSAAGIRTRRYHAYLIVAAPHDERRFALVNDIELWIDTPNGPIALSSHHYAPDVVHPDGATRLVGFDAEPWPTWRFDIGDGLTVIQQLFAPRTSGRVAMVLQWRVLGGSKGVPGLRLRARPLLSGRGFKKPPQKNYEITICPQTPTAHTCRRQP